jgi:hydrogenase maturation protein HypF
METTVSAPRRVGTARCAVSRKLSGQRGVPAEAERLKMVVQGAVQGVGFRPFVYRLATELKLNGYVSNTAQGVFIEVEGRRNFLKQFQHRIEVEKPPRAVVQSINSSFVDTIGYDAFEIRDSKERGDKTAFILPDIATCADCLREILDPGNRRFGYPFTNCTNCGPRFSIIETLPYDRSNTSMKKFAMCDECEREYQDPLDRRFHAQPNACPECGPHLEVWDKDGEALATRDDALRIVADTVRGGKIVALKGLGGFQLIVDARNEDAVVRLRERKHREEKPFALMYPSLEAVRNDCEVSQLEEKLLLSPEAPIVLLRRSTAFEAVGSAGVSPAESKPSRLEARSPHKQDACAPSIAAGNPNLGVMLPYSPLHHLLMRELNFPIVATSGNLSDEPICIDEHEALDRLCGIADAFLVHDRPIVRHVDDSVVRTMCGREMILRRARGYAPLPIVVGRLCQTPNQGVSQSGAAGTRATQTGSPKGEARGSERIKRPTILAVGGHLKNTVALKIDNNIFVSQHIGDLETKEAYAAFRQTCGDLPRLYDANIDVVACDMHPDYLSTKYALDWGAHAPSRAGFGVAPEQSFRSLLHAIEVRDGEDAIASTPEACATQSIGSSARALPIQHHWAHVAACMAENQIEAPALGVVWDGTGYGLDGTIWGGEFLLAKRDGTFERVAHFRQFRLPGGDRAIKEPRRSGLGLLYEIFGEHAWDFSTVDLSEKERPLLERMLEKPINAPLTSSVGRLFDAVASLIGLRQRASFEGQAAMELEFARQSDVSDAYPFRVEEARPMKVDWEPMIYELLTDLRRKAASGLISAKFHNALVEMIVLVAKKIGERNVVLTGGCFQNRYLTERVVTRLREEKLTPYWHNRIPPNDGGIALGQAVAASWGA